VDALRGGFTTAGLEMPLQDDAIRFPYFGDTLFDLTAGMAAEAIAEVVVRGNDDGGGLELAMQAAIIEKIRRRQALATNRSPKSLASAWPSAGSSIGSGFKEYSPLLTYTSHSGAD
jgi:hypothetical protein